MRWQGGSKEIIEEKIMYMTGSLHLSVSLHDSGTGKDKLLIKQSRIKLNGGWEIIIVSYAVMKSKL